MPSWLASRVPALRREEAKPCSTIFRSHKAGIVELEEKLGNAKRKEEELKKNSKDLQSTAEQATDELVKAKETMTLGQGFHKIEASNGMAKQLSDVQTGTAKQTNISTATIPVIGIGDGQ